MLHCDDEDLSLVALGEPIGQEDEAHLDACSRCQSRLDQLAAVVSSARSITDADRPAAPPAAVWSAITAELGMASGDNVHALTPRRRSRTSRTWLIATAAAIVGVVAGGIVTAGVLDSPASYDVVARADLMEIDSSGYSGTAVVETGDDGPVLVVTVPDLPGVDDGYYEVWMATSDTSTMVAIGTLNAGQQGHFPLPAGMDMGSFPVVDVSVEHFDGEAGHSATSVVRGQLQA